MGIAYISRTAIIRVLLLGLAAGSLTACHPVSEPWDSTGFFKQDRQRSPALAKELRERVLLQQDRTHA
jgi:hypothetical protein